MLAPADAEIARRDPAVPGLALALDPEAMMVRLRAARGFPGLVSARATYVRYKPGTSCLVGYELELEGKTVAAFAKAYRQGDRPKLIKARRRAGPGEVLTLDGELVAVVRAAADRDLPLPRRLAGPDDRRRVLRSLIPGSPELWQDRPRPLRYKPERRWVGVVGPAGRPEALVKGYRQGDLSAALAGLDFAAATSLKAPRLLGASRSAVALASSWIPGEPLSEVLSGPAARSALAETGRALSLMHRQPALRLRDAPTMEDVAAVIAAAESVGSLAPQLGPAACLLGRALHRRLLERSVSPAPRHGDFSPDQVVVTGSGAAIVDFDNAAAGDPAADLGHFLASLDVAGLEGHVARTSVESLGADLLAGYGSSGGPAEPDRVALHRAAALIRLAVEPFRRRQPDWPAGMEATLNRAAELAAPHAGRR